MKKILKRLFTFNKQPVVSNDYINDINYTKAVDYAKNRYLKQYPSHTYGDFIIAFDEYIQMDNFKVNENVEIVGGCKEETHFVMRMITEYYLLQVFKSMKIDMDDENVKQDLSVGNIGTPGRVAKMWCGFDLNDSNELMGGRWSNKPRMASFLEQETQQDLINIRKGIPITKRVDLTAVCSHHLAPFSSLLRPDSYAIVSYIPSKKYIGISKLGKLVDWIAQRGWLQEDLVKAIYSEIVKTTGSKNVYVKLYNIVHTCEYLRGLKSNDGAFTDEFYSGKFKNKKLRDQVQPHK